MGVLSYAQTNITAALCPNIFNNSNQDTKNQKSYVQPTDFSTIAQKTLKIKLRLNTF